MSDRIHWNTACVQGRTQLACPLGRGANRLRNWKASNTRDTGKVTCEHCKLVILQTTPLQRDVVRCQRCGRDHPRMQFNPLLNFPPHGASHFGHCPFTAQPILMKMVRVPA